MGKGGGTGSYKEGWDHTEKVWLGGDHMQRGRGVRVMVRVREIS